MSHRGGTGEGGRARRLKTIVRRVLWVFIGLVAVGVALPFGCVGNRMFNREPADYLRCFETDGGLSYCVAVVEFDDQGEPWDLAQLDAALGKIRQLNRHSERGIFLYQFIHGWKSNASRDVDAGQRLAWFEREIASVARSSEDAARIAGDRPRPVVGLYIGWRGRTYSLPILIDASFWNRRVAANRLVSPLLNEALARTAAEAAADPDSKCVLVGHSMGGMILEKVISRSLMSEIMLAEYKGAAIPMGYDLIVSANPSTEALHTKQLIDLMKRSHVRLVLEDDAGNRFPAGGPLIASITSSHDIVTRVMIPIAMNINSIFVRYRRGSGDSATPSQRELGTRTAGHLPFLHSHAVELTGDGIELSELPGRWNDTPFWVLQVPPEVSADHSDIDGALWRELMITLMKSNRVFDPDLDLRLVVAD